MHFALRSTVAVAALLTALSAHAQPAPTGNTISGPSNGHPPPNSTGIEGNYFFDLSSGNIYGPRTSGQWSPTPSAYFQPLTPFPAQKYGARCDGSHHYLSDISFVNGTDTAGWDVTQWQTMFPTIPYGADISTIDIDGVAISKAFAALRASGSAGLLRVGPGKCFSSLSIDHTGLSIEGVVLDYTGSTITSSAANVAAVDFALTGFMAIYNLNVIGSCTSEPVDGIRLVRPYLGAVAGDHTFYNLTTDGCFKVAALRNMAFEDMTYIHPILANRDTSGGVPVVMDGHNHYNASATEAVLASGAQFQDMSTLTVDSTYYSMTSNAFIGNPRFISTSGPNMWVSGARTLTVQDGYFVNNTPSDTGKNCVTLYQTSDFPNVNLNFQFLCEPYNAGMPNLFWVTSTTATPVLDAFHFDSHTVWPTQSIFGTDTTGGVNGSVPITSVRFSGSITAPVFSNFALVPAPVVFDQPLLWSGAIDAQLQWQNAWSSLTGAFTGEVCVARGCTELKPQESLNANSKFIYDQANEHTLKSAVPVGLTQVADNWVAAVNGSAAAKTSFQALQDIACDASNYDMTITVTTPLASLAAGDSLALRTMIRGPDLQQFNWGQGNSTPLIYDVWLNANYSGNVALFATNYVGTQVVTHDIAVTPGCHEYLWQIPAYTSAIGMSTQPNYVGIRAGVNPVCGSDYQVAPGAWTATAGISSACTANTSNFLATLGNQLKVGPARIIGGYFLTPDKQWSDIKELDAAHNQYLKSVPAGVAPDPTNGYKNAGLTGAFTFTSNVTGAATATVTFNKIFSNAGTPATVTLASSNAVSTNCYDLTAGSDTGGAATATNISDGSFTLNCAAATANHQYAVNYTIMGQQ